MSSAVPADPTALPDPLPLFPLRTVLFPGALLALKVFEARYLDLVGDCLRSGQGFGVICLRQGAEAGRSSAPIELEAVGVLTRVDTVESEQAGILRVQCRAGERFRLAGAPQRRENGLWTARAASLPADPVQLPGPTMLGTVSALAQALRKLQQMDRLPRALPLRLDEAGWVANRWCELLPISLQAKQRLMELDDPALRLSLVDEYLREHQVVAD